MRWQKTKRRKRMSRVALVVKYMNYYGCAIFYSAYNNYSAIEYASIVALRAKYEFSKVIIILKINLAPVLGHGGPGRSTQVEIGVGMAPWDLEEP